MRLYYCYGYDFECKNRLTNSLKFKCLRWHFLAHFIPASVLKVVKKFKRERVLHKWAHILFVHIHQYQLGLVLFVQETRRVKWDEVAWVCKGSQFTLSNYPSKMICAVLDVWHRRPYAVKLISFFIFNICCFISKFYITAIDWLNLAIIKRFWQCACTASHDLGVGMRNNLFHIGIILFTLQLLGCCRDD